MSLLKRVLDRLGILRTRLPVTPVFPPETSLLTLPKFVPAGFQQGVEILNDNTTQMEFVVNAVMNHIGVSRQEAIRIMLTIHTRGGILLAMPSMAEAEKAALGITADAREQHYSLACRAVRKTADQTP